MDADKEERYADFPVFKGLQKPLEFMGFQAGPTHYFSLS